ncbi:hypothetical protein V5O48_014477 [Marasmius crinis-equi]|uniref:Uncharacterized protein n=1 Tax=Marasmius crinis-equi TaxID=585013 RepID=A0ABR3EX94_9AGAR
MAIYVAETTWVNVYQTLISFNAAKTRDYIPLIDSLSGSTAQAAQGSEHNDMLYHEVGAIMDHSGFECLNAVVIELHHRLSAFWGHKKRVLYPTAFVVIVADIMGFAIGVVLIKAYCTSDDGSYEKAVAIDQVLVIVTAVYTALLTLLTAGRIWYISREARRSAGTSVGTLDYNTIVATILESGILYAIALLISAIVPTFFTDPTVQGLSPFDFNVIAILMMGIAPTMMIVRIAYGKSVESVEQVITTLRFAEAANGSQQRSTGVPRATTTADFRESFFDTLEERAPGGEREKPYVTTGENMA